jgi:hypothetical protein
MVAQRATLDVFDGAHLAQCLQVALPVGDRQISTSLPPLGPSFQRLRVVLHPTSDMADPVVGPRAAPWWTNRSCVCYRSGMIILEFRRVGARRHCAALDEAMRTMQVIRTHACGCGHQPPRRAGHRTR